MHRTRPRCQFSSRKQHTKYDLLKADALQRRAHQSSLLLHLGFLGTGPIPFLSQDLVQYVEKSPTRADKEFGCCLKKPVGTGRAGTWRP